MSLERFREAADERTAHLRMTPELHARILAALSGRRGARHRGALLVLAACMMVMIVSAGILALEGDWFAKEPSPDNGLNLASGQQVEVRLSDWKFTNETVLTPTEGENGLWGYTDETGRWIVEPVYVKAGEVKGISALVVDEDGKEYFLTFY